MQPKENKMIPEKQKNTHPYEKVPTDDFVAGTIAEVQYEQDHVFKGFQGAPDKTMTGVRFKFDLDGCEKPHYTKWMKFVWNEKSNLFKFMNELVGGISEDVRIDVDCVKGMKVKTLWSTNGDWQNLDKIRPIGGKISYQNEGGAEASVPDVDVDEFGASTKVPF
jgi:hypothetical protein